MKRKQKSLMVPEDLQQEIKIYCAKKNISIVSFVERFAKKAMKENK